MRFNEVKKVAAERYKSGKPPMFSTIVSSWSDVTSPWLFHCIFPCAWGSGRVLYFQRKRWVWSNVRTEIHWIWGAEPQSSFCSWLLCLQHWSNQNLGFESFWKGFVAQLPSPCARAVWNWRYSAHPSRLVPKNTAFPILCLQYQLDPYFIRTWAAIVPKFSITTGFSPSLVGFALISAVVRFIQIS